MKENAGQPDIIEEVQADAVEAASGDEDTVVVVDPESEVADQSLDNQNPVDATNALEEVVNSPEEYITQANELAQIIQMERETQLAEYKQLLAANNGEKLDFDQVADIIDVLENMRDNVDEMNALLGEFQENFDVELAYGYLEAQRQDSLLLIDEILANVSEPEGLMDSAQTIEEIGVVLQAWAGNDVEKQAQAKRIQERIDKTSKYAGIGYDAFVQLNEGSSLDEFISFLIDPIGTSSTREFNFGSVELGEITADLVVLHQFRTKMKQKAEVAKAFATAMQSEFFSSWASTRLASIEEAKNSDNPDALKSVLVEFYKTVLMQDTSEEKKIWNAFNVEFTTALFGGEKKKFGDEKSVQFLEDMLKDDGKKLAEFWNLGSSK